MRLPAEIADLIVSTPAAMSPSRNGSWPGDAPSRNARASSGSSYPRRTSTRAVVSLSPSASARARAASWEHDLTDQSMGRATVRWPSDSDVYPEIGDCRSELLLGRGLHGRVPRVPVRVQRRGLRAARDRGRCEAGARGGQRPRRGRDRGSGRARGGRVDRGAALVPRALPRASLGAIVTDSWRIARLLAAQARLPRRLARPSREGRTARSRLGRRRGGVRVPGPPRRPRAPRARARSFLARSPVPPLGRATPNESRPQFGPCYPFTRGTIVTGSRAHGCGDADGGSRPPPQGLVEGRPGAGREGARRQRVERQGCFLVARGRPLGQLAPS